MDDLGLNKYLLEQYGTTPEGLPFFRLIWSTGITEKRYSEFTDFYGDIFLRTVREVREVLKYPFAQDRWILERVKLISPQAREIGLVSDSNFSYEEVYTFQDREGNFLPLSLHMMEVALFLYFKFYLARSRKELTDVTMERVARKELERKKKIREVIGDGSNPYTFVLE